jgi:hypothetical protein
MSNRRNLTPPAGTVVPGLPPTRRATGGARHEVSERVHFHEGERELTGWALNVSRGGVRAIVEDKVELGQEFEISIGENETRRPGRIVWIQDEPDGSIVGVSFLDDPPGRASRPDIDEEPKRTPPVRPDPPSER